MLSGKRDRKNFQEVSYPLSLWLIRSFHYKDVLYFQLIDYKTSFQDEGGIDREEKEDFQSINELEVLFDPLLVIIQEGLSLQLLAKDNNGE